MSVSAKRFYGPAWFALNAAALGHAATRGRARDAHATLGPLVTHTAPMVFLAGLYLRRRGRTSAGLPWLRAAVGVGAVLSLAPAPGRRGRLARTLVLGVAGTEGYIRWYSRLGRTRSAALEVGARFPDEVGFVDGDGRTVTGADLRGRATALFFYRGNWCPLCVAQVGEMAARWSELEALGVEVALVSPQDDAHTRSLAQRFDVPFRYLRDPGLTAARALGLVHEGGVPPGLPGYEPDTVFPTIVVMDADGLVMMSDQTDDYRVRPEPETILAALRTAA